MVSKVLAGATLCLSLDDAYLPTFNSPLGVEVANNTKRRGSGFLLGAEHRQNLFRTHAHIPHAGALALLCYGLRVDAAPGSVSFVGCPYCSPINFCLPDAGT